jgi:cobyrinic acid a,c-diamide synthase
MAALARRGLAVAPFKCGPDFIDPGYHRAVTGTTSINLDGWMCPESCVRETFLVGQARMTGRTVAVIEGAMGLFDGIGASSSTGSSAQIAAITGAPVVLVVNARGMAASAAALVKGFSIFDSRVRLAGVIFNNVGSESHTALLKQALADHCPETTCFGCIPRDESLGIPSRHLGLVTAEDNPLSPEFITGLADMAERCLDLDRLSTLDISHEEAISLPTPPQAGMDGMLPVRIAVARDPAFCFMYEDNLRLLRDAGAEPVFFSPIFDTALPPDIQGIYLPGGYPELYAGQLSGNRSMVSAISSAVAADMPVYAECGGFVYLTEGLETAPGQTSADFVGIFPVRCRMLPKRKALGYRQAELTGDTVIGTAGATVRGHEFHYSEIGTMPEKIERCYRVSRQGIILGEEGFQVRNCLASYLHLHFGSNPDIARNLVAACRTHKALL